MSHPPSEWSWLGVPEWRDGWGNAKRLDGVRDPGLYLAGPPDTLCSEQPGGTKSVPNITMLTGGGLGVFWFR